MRVLTSHSAAAGAAGALHGAPRRAAAARARHAPASCRLGSFGAVRQQARVEPAGCAGCASRARDGRRAAASTPGAGGSGAPARLMRVSVRGMQAEKKVQWQAAEGGEAAAKEEVKREEEEEESEEEEQEEINGGLLIQDLAKLDVASLTPLTPEVIRCGARGPCARVGALTACEHCARRRCRNPGRTAPSADGWQPGVCRCAVDRLCAPCACVHRTDPSS